VNEIGVEIDSYCLFQKLVLAFSLTDCGRSRIFSLWTADRPTIIESWVFENRSPEFYLYSYVLYVRSASVCELPRLKAGGHRKEQISL